MLTKNAADDKCALVVRSDVGTSGLHPHALTASHLCQPMPATSLAQVLLSCRVVLASMMV
eukprot:m.640969 g.640969  ORF g.640969 m.640969 type:complete len:60 (-) comp22625_c0_seq5:23-202(-)